MLIEARLPYTAARIFVQPAVIVVGTLQTEGNQLPVHRIQHIGPIAGSSNQQPAVPALEQAGHTRLNIVGETIVTEGLAGIVEALQTLVRAYPQMVVAIEEERHHHIGMNRGAVVIAMQESMEVIAVKTVQTIVRTYPYVSLPVLTEVRDQTAGEAVRREEVTTLCHGT